MTRRFGLIADPLRRGDDREPWITPDGNTIYFKSDRLATTPPAT